MIRITDLHALFRLDKPEYKNANNFFCPQDIENTKTGRDQPSPGTMKNTMAPATMMKAISLRSYLIKG